VLDLQRELVKNNFQVRDHIHPPFFIATIAIDDETVGQPRLAEDLLSSRSASQLGQWSPPP